MFQMDIEYEFQQEFIDYQSFDREFNNSKWDYFGQALEVQQSQKTADQLPAEDIEFIEWEESKSVAESSLKLAEESSGKLHSKDCLKFSRRAVKMMNKHLAAQSSFVTSFMGASAKIFNVILTAFALKEVPTAALIKSQVAVLSQIWEEFKSCLSYHKNKKICIVKAEYWNKVFCKKTFAGLAKQMITNLHDTQIRKLLMENEAILNCFSEILFSVNQLMTLTLILKDSSEKGGQFMRKIETLDNLLVLITNSDLFEFYNHRSGKFAKECCGRCKVCRSRSIPAEFTSVLLEARTKISTLVDVIPSICPKDLEIVDEQQLFYILSLMVRL